MADVGLLWLVVKEVTGLAAKARHTLVVQFTIGAEVVSSPEFYPKEGWWGGPMSVPFTGPRLGDVHILIQRTHTIGSNETLLCATAPLADDNTVVITHEHGTLTISKCFVPQDGVYYFPPGQCPPQISASTLDTLVCAFDQDPYWLWLQPDAAKRAEVIKADTRALVTCGKGHIATMEGGKCCMLWFSNTSQAHTLSLVRHGLLKELQFVDKQMLQGFSIQTGLGEEQEKAMAGVNSYWYLSLFGTDPSLQGKGIGGRMMKWFLASAKAANVAIYLETSNPRARDLYSKFGFVLLGEFAPNQDSQLPPPKHFLMRLPAQ